MSIIILRCQVRCDYCGTRSAEMPDYPRTWTHVLLENGQQVAKDRCPDCGWSA